jgi:uncharacterized protein YndB with AHSA1/START domain
MLKWIGIIVVFGIAAVLALAATKPGAFRIERKAHINAPAEKVFEQIDDFRNWRKWSPWEKKDPAMKSSFGASATGKGATYEWDGNSAVGKGSMEILESSAPGRIRLKLDFEKPMTAHNEVEFTLVPGGNATDVTWAMYGANNFASKLMQVFVSMESMVGPDFEAGLASLKAVSEQQ